MPMTLKPAYAMPRPLKTVREGLQFRPPDNPRSGHLLTSHPLDTTGPRTPNREATTPNQLGPPRHPLSDDLLEFVAERLALLAHPIRLQILERLRQGPLTVAALTNTLPTTQQNVSRHLAHLHRAGLVTRTREGRCVRYAVGSPMAQRVVDLMVCEAARHVAHLARSFNDGNGLP